MGLMPLHEDRDTCFGLLVITTIHSFIHSLTHSYRYLSPDSLSLNHDTCPCLPILSLSLSLSLSRACHKLCHPTTWPLNNPFSLTCIELLKLIYYFFFPLIFQLLYPFSLFLTPRSTIIVCHAT